MGLKKSKRIFIVEDSKGKHKVNDPLPGAPVIMVKKELSSKYPSITNSVFSEPIADENGDMVFTISSQGGTHG